MKKLISLLFLCVINFAIVAQITQPRIGNSISNLHVNDLIQDDQGIMWIATAKGLCRYDGVSYSIFYHDKQQSNSISSDNITALYFDGHNLWCANGDGVSKFDMNTWRFTNYRMSKHSGGYGLGFFISNKKLYTFGFGGIYEINESTKMLESCMNLDGQVVQKALVDKHGRIWVICDGNEILCFDSSLNLCRKIDFDGKNEVYSIFIMPNQDILLGTKNGTLVIDKNNYSFSASNIPLLLAHEQIRYIKYYALNKVVIGTKDNELKFFDFSKGSFIQFPNMDNVPNSNIMDLTCSFLDNNDNLWLGTFNRGLKFLSQQKKLFDSDKALIKALSDKFVTRIQDDGHGNLWIGTRYNGLIKYNKITKESTEYSASNSPLFKQFGNFIQSLYIDSSNRLWTCNESNLLVFDISKGSLQLKKSFTDVGNIVTIAEDSKKRIWVGSSFRGIKIYDNNLNVEKSFLPATGKSNNITRIIPYSSSMMLFSAFGDNIYYIDINTLRTKVVEPKFSNYFKNVVNLRTTPDNKIIIGTYGDGMMIYSPSTHSIKILGYKDGLQSNDVLGIEEDKNHNLWVSSSFGIYRVNLTNNKVRPYFIADGTLGDQYHEKSECITTEGDILFGGNHGITQIHTENINSITKNIPILLTDLKVFNRSIPISTEDEDGILKCHISRTKEIELSYDQNVFSLDFIGLTYSTPKNIEYAYKLEGFDKDWNYTGEYNRASYSNLPSGKYIFKVKIKNGADEWENEKELLTITVLPSPWLCPLAILCYVVLFFLILFLINRIYIRIRLNKERNIMAQNEIRREKTLAQMKVNFFTNISHELRTPLTMIYNPIKILMKDNTIDNPESQSLIKLINKNAERLLKLIDQILDYGKIKNDTLELKVSKNDCIMQISDIINIYKLYAAEKNISVELDCPYEHLIVLYDTDKLDKIMNNLLFNSVKYTPIGGHVKAKVELTKQSDNIESNVHAENYLKITIEDDGSGVEKALLPNIFDRFSRLVKGEDAIKIKGSGVGLNYVKHLVENHKGTIIAKNGEEKGMIFVVTIPIDESAYSENEIALKEAFEPSEPEEDSVVNADIDNLSQEAIQNDKKKILVVEDNKDMANLLRSMLSKDYEVDKAYDGEDALEKIKIKEPDLIISDVMMPRMDGFTFCKAIKTDASLCHIPIILLTAKTLDEDKIEGYKDGADMYLNKPFNPDLLLTMINNIFNRSLYRQNVIVRMSGVNSDAEREELRKINEEMSPLDKRFLEKLNNYIDENISNSELNVNFLGKELGFSRTNFYRKVKSLTGMTPNDFLKVFRLNRAAELIKLREYPLNEISEMTGFGTQSHFSSCFKKYFGVSPKDYLSK